MTAADVVFLPEAPAHDSAIEHINEEAFGPGRYTRAAYKIREGGPHERALSFVAMRGGEVVGSVRMTRIAVGESTALLLGPLAVRPAHKNLGIGRRLVEMAVAAAARAGYGAILLVGDEPYYGPLGFTRIPRGRVKMPRPVDPNRLLVREITQGAAHGLAGEVTHADLAKPQEPARAVA
jgi:predicted N-acetyltransferase YhbS